MYKDKQDALNKLYFGLELAGESSSFRYKKHSTGDKELLWPLRANNSLYT